MRYIRDTTGRFRMRPYYEAEELDQECEQIITNFMQERCGRLIIPISTDALTKLIERDAEDLDLYADLSAEGFDVQGVTNFYPGQKPRVRIAEGLSQDRYEHRLRTTLTHEYGHVRFHKSLWDQNVLSLSLFPNLACDTSCKCKRESILGTPMNDWMEWQAGYICGALLMPRMMLKNLVTEFVERQQVYCPLNVASADAAMLTNIVATRFDVSRDAARMRLLKLKYLTNAPVGSRLFS